MSDNCAHLERHARHALEDFNDLRRDPKNEELWHSLSHHLRHVAYRAHEEMKDGQMEIN